MTFSYLDIAQMIDHSLLNPALTEQELRAGCLLAKEYEAATAVVLPYFAQQAVELLAGGKTLPCSTVGFPHGGHVTQVKVLEAQLLLEVGCRELDMVVNISKVKSHDYAFVAADVRAVTEAAHAAGAKLKVIFENRYLSDDEKIRLCEICGELSVDWVKTSTGYADGGSTWEDLELMRRHAPPHVQVKAAGGVRDLDAVLRARALGITRVGASATKKILDDCRARLGAGG